jgi:hypothetical protein
MFFSCRNILKGKKEGMKMENEIQSVNEVNIGLNEKMDANSKSLSKAEGSSVTETNSKLKEAFYGEKTQEDVVPTYVTNETAAIKITGGEK